MAREKLNSTSNGNTPGDEMSRFQWAVIAPVMAVLIAWGAGRERIGPPPAEAGPAIRPDGVVEIVKPDGFVAATLAVEIAETPEARARGLMGRVLSDYLAG